MKTIDVVITARCIYIDKECSNLVIIASYGSCIIHPLLRLRVEGNLEIIMT